MLTAGVFVYSWKKISQVYLKRDTRKLLVVNFTSVDQFVYGIESTTFTGWLR